MSLPAIHDDIAARARCSANRIASPRSGTRQNVSPSRPPLDLAPAAISSRMPSSDSVRGSSAVSTVRSASSAEVSAIMRRLALSRKPAEPKTAMTRPFPLSPSPPGRKHFSCSLQCNLQCIRRMSEINNRREILSHIDTFHATGNSFKGGNSLRSNFRFYFQAINRSGQRRKTIRDVIRAQPI